ncbi:hypothetical protein YPPY99_3474, partial [Yersinia pestis PY-99]
MAWQGF